jgi:hypothetical protein
MGNVLKANFAPILLLSLFAVTQVLGILFQYTMFEIEKQENPGITITKQESASLSPYRETKTPVFVLPILFIIAINFYLFIFKFSFVLKIFKVLIYLSAIFSFALITSVVLSIVLSLLVNYVPMNVLEWTVMGGFYGAMIIPTILLILKKYLAPVRMLIGISLCAVAGSAVASYFTIETILILLVILSVFDYVFVKKTKQIVKLVEVMDKQDVLFSLDVGRGRGRRGERGEDGKRSGGRGGETPGVPMEKGIEKGETTFTGHQLGFGDLIFSTGVSVAMYIDRSFLAALVTMGFITISLGVYLYYLHKIKVTEPQPALPPIMVGGILGTIVSRLLF